MELREKYKLTEVGLIPDDWKLRSIQSLIDDTEILEHIDGNHGELYPRSNEFVEDGIPYISATDFVSGTVKFNGCKYLTAERCERFQKGIAKNGDILFAHNATVGPVAFLETQFEFIILSTTATLFRVDNERLLNQYLRYALQAAGFVKQYQAVMSQSTRFQVPITTQRKFKIPIPPTKAEQTAIATALSDMDNLVAGLEKLIEKKKAIKQGAMQELLRPKEGWEVKTLRELVRYRRGSFPQPYGLDKWYDDISGAPFVQVFDVDDNFKLKDETKRRISKAAQSMSVYIKKGSLIITLQGSIGRIAITQYDAYVDRTLLIFESFIIPFNTYFFALSVFLLFEKEKENAPGGIIKTITKEALSSFPITYPALDEQNRIAEILIDIDNEIEKLESQLFKYQTIKSGMMQELLTGKTRLV